MKDFRVGQGIDVHAIGTGDFVTLCGVRIDCGFSLIGHSDADVAYHALTDALLGAIAAGDIGTHFPPTDPQWKGAASHIFVERAYQLVREGQWDILNMDVTIICERPKILPHRPAMIKKLAQIFNLEAERISVKATTTEKLGFTGRGEGIASLAIVTLGKDR